MPPESPFSPTADGLRVALRLQPGASRARIEGTAQLDDGAVVLKVRVTEPPENGKANAALIKLLAKTWKLPKSAISLVAGHGNRHKILLIAGPGEALQSRLQAWLATLT